MSRIRRMCWLPLALAVMAPAQAGEIAGLSSNTPPFLSRPLEVSFGNDFLGLGGSPDDFRTQQFIISGSIGERWQFTFDHSTLTLIDIDEPARTDQLSAALGYRLIDSVAEDSANRLTVGLGLRSYGDFGGERMQNGAHQIVRNSVEVASYTDVDRTDATAWVDAQHYALLTGATDSANWRWGYWLRGSALWASDGQLDAAAGIYGVARRGPIDLWLGIRHDWRSGYEEPVLLETALAEEDLAAVFGVRWGPLLFESVQQFDNEASYLQLRLIPAGFDDSRANARQSRFTFDAGMTAPDVYLSFAGRWQADWLNSDRSNWQRSLFISAGFGEPQHDDDPMIYRRTVLAGGGIEWERQLDVVSGRTSGYVSLGAGWRQERIFGDDERAGERSDKLSDGVALAGAGLRFDTGELIRRYNLRIHFGLSAVVPFSDARLDMAGETFRVQQPSVTVNLGLTLGSFAD